MRLAALAAAVLALLASGPPAAATAPAAVAYRFADPRIDEASGIARGLDSPGIDYVQNDSGGGNRFFAVDERTGATAATITVSGAGNVDWEDIAVARDGRGVPSVWLADIGDNDSSRSEIRVYRVREPRIRPSDRGRVLRAPVGATWRLRYPSGPVDAESLAVAAGGAAYIVTKSALGSSIVYRLPARPDRGRVQTLIRAGRVQFGPTGTRDPFGLPGELAATGAAISADGTLLAVRTYSDAYVWRLRGGDVAAALRGRPARVALPEQPQGEGIALAGRAALIDSEGRHAAVYRVPLPALPGAAPSRPAPARSKPVARAAPSAAAGDAQGHAVWPIVLAGVAVAAAVGGLVLRRRHRRMLG